MIRLRSLRLKLSAYFLMLTLIPLAATGLYGHFFTSRALSQQALERSSHQVHLQAESIVSALRQVQGDALYLSALRSLDMLREQTDASQIALWQREVAQDLLVLASVRPMYAALRLIDLNGDESIGVRATETRVSLIENLQNRGDAPYFTEALSLSPGGVYVSPFQMQDVEGSPYIHYAVRLADSVLVIDLHAGWLLRALPDRPGTDAWLLFDQNGRLLVYPDGFDIASVAHDAPNLLDGGAGSFQTAASAYVYDTIYPASRLDTSGEGDAFWVLARLTPFDVLYASVNDFYRVALVMLVGTVLIAVALASQFSRILVVPVKRLQAMTARFGQDGVAPPLPDRLPHDEIGALTRTFIDMAHELEGKRRQEHRLIERLIRAQEEERKLVAYDLHDGLIQQMVGARFYLTECREICPKTIPNARAGLQRGCDALTEAIVEGRRIIEGLRPATLDDLGLIAAIEEIARTIASAAEWDLKLELNELPNEPEKTVAVTLYRIAQEALNNARKHANAKHVQVSLHNGDGIFLTITDDGVGFDPKTLAGEGHGLGITTMHERASLINGQCTITSQPGQGTRIDVHIPSLLTISHSSGEG